MRQEEGEVMLPPATAPSAFHLSPSAFFPLESAFSAANALPPISNLQFSHAGARGNPSRRDREMSTTLTRGNREPMPRLLPTPRIERPLWNRSNNIDSVRRAVRKYGHRSVVGRGLYWVNHLDRQGWFLVFCAALVVGAFWMRSFGSYGRNIDCRPEARGAEQFERAGSCRCGLQDFTESTL